MSLLGIFAMDTRTLLHAYSGEGQTNRSCFYVVLSAHAYSSSFLLQVSQSELISVLQALAQSTGQDVTLPEGYVWYETMLVLRPDLSEEERCVLVLKKKQK